MKMSYFPSLEKRVEEKVYGFGSAMVAHVDTNYLPLLQSQNKLITDVGAKVSNAETAYSTLVARLSNVESSFQSSGLDPATLTQVIDDVEALKKHSPNKSSVKGSMADAKRCQQMGKLGDQNVIFEQFTDSVEALVSEKYYKGEEILKWARSRGSNPIDKDAIEDAALNLDVEEDDLMSLDRDLWGLLQQQVLSSVYKHIKTAKGHGIESWRRIYQACNPKNAGTAEAIRTEVVRERPAASLQQLQTLLAELDDNIEQYEIVSSAVMEEGVKVLGLRAVLPPDLLLKVDTDITVDHSYEGLRKYVDAYLARALGASRRQGAKAVVPMAVDAVDAEAGWMTVGAGGKPKKSDPTIASLMAALDGIKKRLDGGSTATPALGAVGAGKGGGKPGGTMGKGGTGCHNCGGPHLVRDCPKPRPPKGEGKGGKSGKGPKGGGKGAPQRQGWQICRRFAETGSCPHKEQYGYCRFAHVRLPPKLASIQGMVFEDIASVAVYDGTSGTYSVPENAAVADDLGAVIAGELATISEEVCYACEDEPDATALDQGFVWHR
jgi:HPt (histidine-containing phosphotransfer) domain-containing protein